MPFTFQAYTSPLTASIAQTLQQQGAIEAQRAYATGNAAAQAAQQSGNAWAGAIQGIGQTIGALPGQIVAAQGAQQTQAIRQQQLQQGAIQLADAQRQQQGQAAVAGMLQGDQLPAGDAGPRQPSYLDANGLYDVPALTARLGQLGYGDRAGDLVKSAETINDSIQKAQDLRQKTAQQNTILYGDAADGVLKLLKAGTAPGDAIDVGLAPLVTNKLIDPAAAARIRSQLAALPPDQLQTALNGMRDQAAKLAPTKTLAEGAQETDRYGRTVATGGEKPKTEAELAADAANPASPTQQQSQQAMKLLKPPPARANEVDDQKYRDITAQAKLGNPVSPEDAAWAFGYEKQKTLGVDTSASAAANRQTAAIGAQTQQQQRAQNFTQLQAARKDIQDNVDKPYATAQSGADTLRDTVHAAQAGNKVAGSLQSLEATMGALRAQGFNRINTAEIGATGNAGSLWDNIAGWMGKKAEGQPIPADVQKDMLAFADILDQAAAKKYVAAHDATNKLYGTTIPRTYNVPTPDASGGTGATARVRVIGPNGETGTVPAGSALPPGWRTP